MAVNNMRVVPTNLASGWRYGIANTFYGKGTTGSKCASPVYRGAGAAENFLLAPGSQNVVEPILAKLRH